MDDKMEYQVQRQHPASITGYDLHQHQVDQRLHSPVLESTHQNNDNPSFPSSTSYQPVEHHPHQQHQYFHQPNYSHQPPAGFNGPFIISPPLCYAQPVVQQTPLPPSTVQFPLAQKQSEQYIQQMREASDRYFESMQKQLQLQYESNMEAINLQFHIFSLYLSAVRQPQHSINQPNVPVHTSFQQQQQQQQQQNEAQRTIVHSIAVPTPPVGISEIKTENSQQHGHSTGVSKSPGVVSCKPLIKINNLQQTDTLRISAHKLNRQKYIQHLLDRNGHRMDSPRRRSILHSDVFEWMVNQSRIDRRLMLFRAIVPVALIIDHAIITIIQPSSFFIHQKTVAMVNSVNQLKGGDVGNH